MATYFVRAVKIYSLQSCYTISEQLALLQAQIGPKDSRRLRLPAFSVSRHIKVAMLSALGTGRLYSPPEKSDY